MLLGVADVAGGDADGCEPGDPVPPGEPDGVVPSIAEADPMMSDAGVMPGGAFWIEANAAVVPRTATTATSGTTSRSSTRCLFQDKAVDDDLRETSADGRGRLIQGTSKKRPAFGGRHGAVGPIG